MSELTEQISGFQRKWMEQQQQLLDDWLKTLQGAGGASPPNTWQQAIDVIEQQVNSALDAQKQSLMTLAESTERVEGVPESFTQWFHQLEEGIEQWNDVQQRLWQTWFDMLRTTTPASEQPGDTLIKNWQEFADRAMEIQQQWLSNWTDMAAKSAKSSRKKTAKPAASGTPSKTEG